MYIYDKANELAAMIKNCDEYKEYKALKDELFADEGTKKLITDYKKLQLEGQAAYLTGKEVPPELMEKLQKLGEVLQFNPKINSFFAAEYKLNTLVSDIYKIIGDACGIIEGMFE